MGLLPSGSRSFASGVPAPRQYATRSDPSLIALQPMSTATAGPSQARAGGRAESGSRRCDARQRRGRPQPRHRPPRRPTGLAGAPGSRSPTRPACDRMRADPQLDRHPARLALLASAHPVPPVRVTRGDVGEASTPRHGLSGEASSDGVRACCDSRAATAPQSGRSPRSGGDAARPNGPPCGSA